MGHFISEQAAGKRIDVNRQKLILASSCLSVCLRTSSAAPNGLIFVKFGTADFYGKSIEKLQIWLK
jgi:hypothetical protein